MSNKGGVPDAWDDDWMNLADKSETKPTRPESPPKLTKAQRKAQHLDQQRRLWDSAENPDRFHWLETQGVVPLKQEFKPQVTLLSRKPGPVIAKRDAADTTGQLTLDDENDSEEELQKKREAELEDRQRKAKLEREEKQRRYAEARERIMGSSKSPVPAPLAKDTAQARDNRRQKGKADSSSRRSLPESPLEQSPNPSTSVEKQLFDPNDMDRRLQPKRESNPTPPGDMPLRQPRGPDHSGRGGYGFGGRGGMAGV